jgi:hypothetical protein
MQIENGESIKREMGSNAKHEARKAKALYK